MNNPIGEQGIIYERIIDFLKSDSRCFVYYGPAGVGKTYLLDTCKENLTYNYFSLNGDKNVKRDYHPICNLISELFQSDSKERKHYLAKEEVKKLAKAAGHLIPSVGDVLSTAIEGGIDWNENSQALTNYDYSSEELDMIHKIASFITPDEKTVFYCDNVQYWDDATTELLYLLAKGDSTFFKNCHFIFSFTTGENEVLPSNMTRFADLCGDNFHRMEYIALSEYSEILNDMGLEISLDNSLLSALYSISEGNLEIIREIVALVNSGKDSNQILTRIIQEKTLTNLLIERMENQISRGPEINKALRFASLFGISFHYHELQNALEEREGYVRDLITNASKHALVKEGAGNIEFIHEIIHMGYMDSLKEKSSDYYLKYADCLRILYPGRYESRAKALELAGENHEANILHVLNYVMQFRTKNSIFREKSENTMPPEYQSYLQQMEKAYLCFSKNEYSDCKRYLESIEDIYPVRLIAERDYLLSITLSKWLEPEYRDIAETCLMPYLEKRCLDGEIELHERILSALLIALVHNNKFENAQEIERLLSSSINERLSYDIDAEISLNILRRKSASTKTPEKAYDLLNKSVKFFEPVTLNKKRGVSLAPLQYYMSLSNLLASALKSGNYKRERENISILRVLPKEYPYLNFPRRSIPSNNIVIASYLNGDMPSRDAANYLRGIINKNNPEDAISFVIQNNIAIYDAMHGDYKKAEESMRSLLQKIDNMSTAEIYYKYLISVNLCAILFLTGKKEEGLYMLKQIINNEQICANKRHRFHAEYLLGAVNDFSSDNPVDWYCSFYEGIPNDDSKMQLYYGRKYLFGELEFWSES